MNSFKITLLILLFACVDSFAQNTKGKVDDLGRIVLNTYISEHIEGLPSAANRMLSGKLSQIASYNGIGGSSINSRFIITPNITVLTKDITTTAPVMIALTLEVTFYIGDGIDGQLFTSTSLEFKGVGKTETKAYVSAIKRINPKHPELKSFVDRGKTEIIEYYNTQCDLLQKEALAKADRKDYDEAILSLLAIPEVCKECYDTSQDLTASVYKMKMDNECAQNIQLAKVAQTNGNWDEAALHLASILPDVSCYNDAQLLLKDIEDNRCAEALGKAKGAWALMDAHTASLCLSEISASSACYTEAIALGTEIKTKLRDDENKEWEFKLKQAQDAVDIKKASIAASHAIGVAQANNPPDTVNYKVTSWW